VTPEPPRRRRLAALRAGASSLENHLIDEYSAGNISRRGLLLHARRIGMGLPLLRGLGGAAGLNVGKATLRVATVTPAGAIDPVTVSDTGGLLMLCQTGEFLALVGPDLVLQPMLAVAWRPNADCSVWIFTLRPGVRFHDGRPFAAADVVATMDRLADPGAGSNALSVLAGVLSKGGTQRVDDLTVRFELDTPCGNFPYYVSSDNYNAIMLPADYAGDFERTFIGTGPFRLQQFTPKSAASFVRHDGYWGRQARPARTLFSFYTDQAPQILALEDGQVDVIAQISVQGAQGLLRDPAIRIIDIPSAIHRQVHMRTDTPAFRDPRVRRAIALTLDRPGIVTGLFRGLARVGNDSPFAPIYPSTDTTVPQRGQNLAAARALLHEAGAADGFAATLVTERLHEIPDYAVLLQNACADIGVALTLRIEDVGGYYGSAEPGSSDWLDSDMGITDYGQRGVPNVTLAAPLLSGGAWNAAHFRNPRYDRLVKSYVAAIDPQAQRDSARHIQTLLLEETPVIIAYFCDYIAATAATVSGVQANAISQLYLADASVG
jgi:peptide/nickel transport system substrate-binding protein